MSRRAKTPRFKEYRQLVNTFDWLAGDQPVWPPGRLTLELGCGRGDFIVELARRYPNQGFAGLDIKSDRMWFGAKLATRQKIRNLVFVRAAAVDLADLLGEIELKCLWLTFPDPYPKKHQAKHRLTHPLYLSIYGQVLSAGGYLYLKTDDRMLFDWTVEQINAGSDLKLKTVSYDLHGQYPIDSDFRIATAYENRFMAEGKKINFLSAVRN
ncbi:MAG TPA: tRNA (guanosine(46)-N7)-methyltransferase TrmB [Candidatus Saccharimonadales bacterium]